MAKIFTFFNAIPPKILLILLWLLAIIIINPIGEFPINDDWAFTRNVYNLAIEHKLVVDQWPAMNLISQTIYGSAFVSCFGSSFTVLRFSITILALLSSLVLYDIVFKLTNRSKGLTLFLVTSFCFGTLFCALSFTFMTDIFFLSFLIFALAQLYKYLESGKYKHYVFFILFSVIAVLDRQHGLLLPVLMAGPIIWKERTIFKKIILSILPFVICWLASDKYRHYLTAYGVWHHLQSIDKIKLDLSPEGFLKLQQHAGDLLLVTGWILLPVTFILMVGSKTFSKKDAVYFSAIAICVLVLIAQAWEQFPYGNISGFLQIGPRVVKVTDQIPDLGFHFLRSCLKIVSFLSITSAIFFLVRDPARIKNKWSSDKHILFPFIAFLGIYFIFIVISESYFDRYALPFALVFLILLIPDIQFGNNFSKFVLLPFASFIFIFSVLEIKDHFSWQRERWKAITSLEQKGIDAHHIDGGFEYNGWKKPSEDFSDPPKSWWWVDDDEYVITIGRIKTFRVDTTFVYQRYIPYRSDTIFVLKKIK